MGSLRPARTLLPLFSIFPVFFGLGALLGGGARDGVMLATEHDVVLDAPAPRLIKIPRTKSEVAQRIRVKVRNADARGAAPFVVRLVVGDGDCPAGTVTGVPDFGRQAGVDSSTIELEPGRTATAVVPILVRGEAYHTHNARTPTRCALAIETMPESAEHVDPTPGNASARLELDVIDQSDTSATALHETVLATLRPLKVTIPRNKSGATKTVAVKVENADFVPVPEVPGHEITLSAEDGDCPPGTVGVPDFARREPGAQSTMLVAGRKRATAKLAVTIDGARFFTANQRALARCTALVRASGPAGNVEPDPSNDVARLVIDVVDKADQGQPTPTPVPSHTPEPSGTAAPTPTATPGPTPVLPPEPADVAPPLDRSVATSMHAATEFLYTGPDPIQGGVLPGTIDPARVAVLRGRVLTPAGEPLPGVTVSILGHPELGSTLSRASGWFDLAVNGGGTLTVRYEKQGLLPGQRQVWAPWRDYALVADVVLVLLDAAVTPIVLGPGSPWQVARGSVVSDADGSRQATLLFPAGTEAELRLPGGGVQPVAALGVRATEYTVGPLGREATPGELPPSSEYTYAVEFGADEVAAAGAEGVRFSVPLIAYVENFLGLPVGLGVPVAFYDRVASSWNPLPDGVVLEILSTDGGRATFDSTGDGVADDGTSLGVSEEERVQLAALYAAGQTLWRYRVEHFTPFDCNMGFAPEPGAEPPSVPLPRSDAALANLNTDLLQNVSGDSQDFGRIDAQDQVLRETVALTTAPFTLHYASDRVPGRSAANRLQIPLSGPSVPPVLQRIELDVSVAGRSGRWTFAPEPNQTFEFVWDGRDVYGRLMQGKQKVKISVAYVYRNLLRVPEYLQASFGYPALIPIPDDIPPRFRRTIGLWQSYETTIGATGSFDARALGLGGWTFGVQAFYDPTARILHLGDGRRMNPTLLRVEVADVVAGDGTQGFAGDGGPAPAAKLAEPEGIAVAPDGTLYLADTANHRVRRIAPDGTIDTIAGDGTEGGSGDGGPAVLARLSHPARVAVCADGRILIADTVNHRIRALAPDGTITAFAGTGTAGFAGDGGPAVLAQLDSPRGLACAADGTVYVADTGNHAVRRVAPGGIMQTLVGNGTSGFNGDGDATLGDALLAEPQGVAIGSDGSVYVADTGNDRVRRVSPAGVVSTVAGSPGPVAGEDYGDGGPATGALLVEPTDVAVGADGAVLIVDRGHARVRRVDGEGTIGTVAGSDYLDFTPQTGSALARLGAGLRGLLEPEAALAAGVPGGPACVRCPATQESLGYPGAVALAADGSFYVTEDVRSLVRHVRSPLPAFTVGQTAIASPDGGAVLLFAGSRHVATVHSLTGATLYTLGYDAAGRLASITDGYGNETVVQRDAGGVPTAIVGPDGLATGLTLDADGFLGSVTDPAGRAVRFTYAPGGLLASVTGENGLPYGFEYDELGRLVRASDPAGGGRQLAPTERPDGRDVTVTTALGRSATDSFTLLQDATSRAYRRPDGRTVAAVLGADGTTVRTLAQGMQVTSKAGPDPRFGMQLPTLAEVTVATAGSSTSSTFTSSATLLDPADLFSIDSLSTSVELDGRSFGATYAGDSRTIAVTTPAGRLIEKTIDERGRVASLRVGGLAPVAYERDGRGRLTAVTLGEGATARSYGIGYDADGRVASVSDPLGRATSFAYDASGRVTRQTLPGGREVALRWDAGGNLVGVTPPGRPEHTFEYSAVDLPTNHRLPDVGTAPRDQRREYDVDRALTRLTRADGRVLALSRDPQGRLGAVTLPDGTLSYAYDPASGQVATIAGPDGVDLGFSYDTALLTRTAWSGAVAGSVARSHDAGLRASAVTVNDALTTTLDYDDDGLIAAAGDLVVVRDAVSGLVSGTSLGAVHDVRTHDEFGTPASVSVLFGATPLYEVSLVRDALGRITRKTETIEGVTEVFDFGYDASGALAEVQRNGTSVALYRYDANGNRVEREAGGAVVAGVHDDRDRLVSYGTATFTHSGDGERTAKTDGAAVTTYAYDAQGVLERVVLPGGSQIEYLVDGKRRRVAKLRDGTVVQAFLYDGTRPVAELDASGDVVAHFVHARREGAPAYMTRAGRTYRIVADPLGSPRLVVDVDTGAVAQRLDYDEFGRVTRDTNPGFQPFGFAGGLYDADTGLVHFGAREYDPEVGRWTSPDPIGFAAGSTNLYAYVGNDPVNRTDPSGLGPAQAAWIVPTLIWSGADVLVRLLDGELFYINQAVIQAEITNGGLLTYSEYVAFESSLTEAEFAAAAEQFALIEKSGRGLGGLMRGLEELLDDTTSPLLVVLPVGVVKEVLLKTGDYELYHELEQVFPSPGGPQSVDPYQNEII